MAEGWNQGSELPARAEAAPSRSVQSEERYLGEGPSQRSKQVLPSSNSHFYVEEIHPESATIPIEQIQIQAPRMHHSLLQSLEPIRSVSEKAKFYHPQVPHILLFTNGTEWLETTKVPVTLKANPPSWLVGCLYVIGPALFDIEYLSSNGKNLKVGSSDNWADGLALVHRFEFRTVDGPERLVVNYRNRFPTTAAEERIRRSCQVSGKSTFSDPDLRLLSQLERAKWRPDESDVNPNMTIVIAGASWTTSTEEQSIQLPKGKTEPRLLANGKYSFFQELDPVTLMPKRVRSLYQLNPAFQGILTSNLVHDRYYGETIQAVMDPGIRSTYTIFSVTDDDLFDPPGHVICKITAAPSKFFQIAVTKHYIVLILFPYSGNWKCGLRKGAVNELKFDTEGITLFYVVDRQKRKMIATYRATSVFGKFINAFEDDENVCIDLAAYDSDLISICYNIQNMRTLGSPPFPQGNVRRYTLARIPEGSGRKEVEAMFSFNSDSSLEFPTINPNESGKRHRFIYGLSYTPEARLRNNQFPNVLTQLDTDLKTLKWWEQQYSYPGPPIVVESPGSSRETLIFSIVLDDRAQKSFLLCLDQDFQELFRTDLPSTIPLYSSGTFLKQS